jgi:hypothetical protein
MNLMDKYRELSAQIDELTNERREVEREIWEHIKSGLQTYGRCIKQLVCVHQSDSHKPSDDSIIKVGDLVHFHSYPIYESVTFHPCWGEYFEVEMDTEYFEIFQSIEKLECVTFKESRKHEKE